MLDPVRHLGSKIDYFVHKPDRDRADRETALQLAWADRTTRSVLPAGLTLQWLGTAGFALSFQDHTLLVDPYVTRLSLGDMLRRRVVRPSQAALDRWVGRADAILVGHTHFDHALDVPAIARRTGARVYGSSSMATLMRLHDLEAQAVEVDTAGATYESGPFRITFVPSAHSKLVFGMRVPMAGEITCEHLDELIPQAYRCSQVWGIHIAVAGMSIYHQGSAELVDDAVRHRDVDLFLCGIAGREFSDRYVDRVMRKLTPSVVVPMHFDDFLRPLEAPLGFTPGVDLTGFAEEVRRVSSDIDVRTLRPGEMVIA